MPNNNQCKESNTYVFKARTYPISLLQNPLTASLVPHNPSQATACCIGRGIKTTALREREYQVQVQTATYCLDPCAVPWPSSLKRGLGLANWKLTFNDRGLRGKQ